MRTERQPWHYDPPIRGALWAVLFAAVVWFVIGMITLYIAGRL